MSSLEDADPAVRAALRRWYRAVPTPVVAVAGGAVAAAAALSAATAGARLASPLLTDAEVAHSTWAMVLPLVVVLIAASVHARALYPLVIGFPMLPLLLGGGAGHERFSALEERGTTREAVVVAVEERELVYGPALQSMRYNRCEAEYLDGGGDERLWGNSREDDWCRGAGAGDVVVFVVDPAGEHATFGGEPSGTRGLRVVVGVGIAGCTAAVAVAAAVGHHRRTRGPAREPDS